MAGPKILSLFSGVGGIELAVGLAFPGSEVVGYVERDSYAAAALMARMEEQSMDLAPVFCGEIQDMDGRELRGHVDVVCGGIPCQPYSLAGQRRGDEDDRALWHEFARIVGECRPSLVFIENVPTYVTGSGFRPLGEELSGMGYEIADRSSLVREMLARLMFASGSSYWPTAVTTDEKSTGVAENRTKESGRHSGTTLTDATRGWPTPMTITGGAESQERKQELGRTESGGGDLQAAANLWQTPKGSAAGETSRSGDWKDEELLWGQAKKWPTPAARDEKGANSETHCLETGAGRKHMDQLPNFIAHGIGPWAKGEYPTPSATRYGTSQNEGEVPHERPSAGTPSLETWASSRQDLMTTKSGGESSAPTPTSPQRLNARFVEWLMGLPIGWTEA